MEDWRCNNYFLLVVFMTLNILAFVSLIHISLGSTLLFNSWLATHWLILLGGYLAIVSVLILGNLAGPGFKEFFVFWGWPRTNKPQYAVIGYRPGNRSNESETLDQHHTLFLTQEIAWLSCVFLVFFGLGVLPHD